jgi:hypothetical protein
LYLDHLDWTKRVQAQDHSLQKRSLPTEPRWRERVNAHHRPLLPLRPAPSKRSLVSAFSLSALLELMLRVRARFARPEQPLCGIGNEQVPIGIDFPLNGYPALFLGHLDPKPGRRLDPLAQ